jgi:hypothetical protein
MSLQIVKSVFRIFIFGCTLSCCAYSCGHDSDEVQTTEEKINVSSKAVIGSPINNAVFEIDEELLVTIDAQDSDGIDKVQLLINNADYGLDTTAPFSFNVSDLAIGDHTLKIVVVDVLGYTTSSQDVSIVIEDNSPPVSGDYATEFDGGILVPERRERKLIIYNGETDAASMDWTNPANILWSMNLHNADGVAPEDMAEYNSYWRGGTSINEAKRVIHNGKNHIIAVGNGGDGIAMVEFDTKKCVYWGKAAGSPHSVEYLPGGVLAVANPKGSGSVLELYKTTENNKGPVAGADISFAGIHGVVWSDKQQVLWVWGGSKLRSYSFNNDLENPKLTEASRYLLPDGWEGAGHDASPMSGTNKLLLACNQGIITFDTDTKEFEIVKLTTENNKYKNNKGLSYNPITQEIIMIKSDDGDGSYRVRSITSNDRNMGDDKRAYKTRWFYVKDF